MEQCMNADAIYISKLSKIAKRTTQFIVHNRFTFFSNLLYFSALFDEFKIMTICSSRTSTV